jgi:hypothetical protein
LTQEYPWYEIVGETDELEQGDFIDDFEVLVPTYIPNEAEINTPNYRAKGISNKYDVVIVSQSCDLSNEKLEYVLLCPRINYSQYIELNKHFGAKAIANNLQNIERGWQPKYCMLNKCDLPDLSCEIQLVELGTVYSVPYDIFRQMVKPYRKRLRLLSPYKEKLAQAFAYYYMRVALPINIEKFDAAKIQAQINTKLLR